MIKNKKMAQVVIPYSNKSNQHVKVVAGTGTSVSKTGSGTAGNPFVYTVNVTGNNTQNIANNTSKITNNEGRISSLDSKIKNLQRVSHRQAAEKYCFYVDLSVSGTNHTLTQAFIETITNSTLTGYKQPTIASANTAVGVNNQYNVSAFMTNAHTSYSVKAYVKNRTDTSNYAQELNQYDVECFNQASGSFSFRIIADQLGFRGVPLANNQLDGQSLRIYFDIEGTK